MGTPLGPSIYHIPTWILWEYERCTYWRVGETPRKSLPNLGHPNSCNEASKRILTQRVHVPNNLVLGIWVIGTIVLVLGKYMIIGYLDP